jgi:uncharacterized oligopeptide transporter (OPT) family protein
MRSCSLLTLPWSLLAPQFGLNPGVSFLALLLGFMFAFVGVNASGTTDTNPVGVIAKAGQLIIGGVTKGQGISVQLAQRTSLVAGSIVGQSASHSVDMVGDLKTGHLIGASPRAQFWAQLAGSAAGFAFAPGLFLIFAKAYPCINDPTIEVCSFSLPAVAAWKAVAIAVSQPKLPVTLSSGMTAVGLSIVASICHIGRFYLPPKYAIWIPNWNAVGLAFVVPQVYYGIAMAVGSIFAMVWVRIFLFSTLFLFPFTVRIADPLSSFLLAFAFFSGATPPPVLGGLGLCSRGWYDRRRGYRRCPYRALRHPQD